jgi:hypothetical protein
MIKELDSTFEGSEILRKMGVAWFVSYAYYNHIDDKHLSWKNSKFSELSIQSRSSGYNKSIQYHFAWLYEVTKMQQLNKHKNFCGLESTQIKIMAAEIILKMLRQ